MILGIGSDLCDIRRIEKTLARFGDRFLERCFTPVERRKSERRREGGQMAGTLAKRYAAKEACAKALGTGLARGVFWKEMGVVNIPGGQPELELSGGALARLEALVPEGMEARVHLSLTDEYPLAQAHVIISAVPAGNPGA